MIELIKSTLEQQSKEYSALRLQVFVFRRDTRVAQRPDDWRLLQGRITAINHVASPIEPTRLDYGDFVYEERPLSFEELLTLVEELLLGSVFRLADRALTMTRPISLTHEYATKDRYPPVADPCHWFRTHLGQVSDLRVEPLLKLGLPVYPDYRTLAHHLFGLRDEYSDSWIGAFDLLLPGYGAIIDDVRVKGRRVEVRTRIDSAITEGYKIFAWARRDSEHYCREADVKGPRTVLRFPKPPKNGMVFLYEIKTHSMVDRWGNTLLDLQKRDEVPPRTPEDWRRRILEGEGQDLEFKHFIDPPGLSKRRYADRIEAHEIAKQLVAFANSNDGAFLLGVDDEGGIHGVDDPRAVKAKVTEFARNNCDPPITPRITVVNFGRKKVVAVFIPHKPRIHATKGGQVYIRCVGTSRPASASEINSIVSQAASPIPGLMGLSTRRRRP